MKVVAAVLALSAVALAAPTQESQDSKVPVTRRNGKKVNPDGSANLDWFFSQVHSTVRKYNKEMELPDVLVNAPLTWKRQPANEPLTDFTEGNEDELYYGTGTVGAAAQKFTFDFDTGSSDTFVPGPQCGTSQGCDGTTKYNQQGQDEGNTTTITYGSGEVSGENYFDSVTIAGLTATHQNIISLTQAQGFSGTGSDSLMGMGFQTIANSGQPPYFFTLINQGKVSPHEFSFYLGRQESGTANQSEMTLGGRDSSRYTGSFTSVPVTTPGYWQVAIDGATVGSSDTLTGTAGQAAIDTGTTLIIAPTAAATAIFAQIPGSLPIPLVGGSFTYYAYPCDSNPQVNLVFAGKKFSINALDFNFGTLEEALGLPIPGLCLAGILAGDISPTEELYVVGDAFLKSWYSVYTVGSGSNYSGSTVSFAKAN